MSADNTYHELLNVACGVFLLTAVVVLWRRQLTAVIRVLAAQGVALAVIVFLLGVHQHRAMLVGLAVGICLLRAWALPTLARRVLARDHHGTPARETRPLVNVAASLLSAAVLTLIAYAAAQPLTALDHTPTTRALPAGLAVVLIGFFALVTRRHAVSQVIGFLVLDNGITATAFLTAAGMPPIVELGVSFDLLLAVLVLQLLTTRMRAAFGSTDLDDLRELHD